MMNVHPKRVVKSASSENIFGSGIKLNRWLLLSIGVCPQTSIVKKILVTIQILIFASLVAIFMIPCTLYVLFDDEHIQIRLGALVSLLSRIMSATAYWVMLMREKDIYNCIRHMETDWKLIQRSDDRKVMFQYTKIGIFLVKISAAFLHFGGTTFIVTRMAKTTTFTVGNETFTTHPMTCPIYKKIIDVRFSPTNEIFLSLQLLSSIASSCISVTIFSIVAIFAMHACGQCRVLCTWLNEVAQNNGKNNLTEEKIAIIVKHHLRIFSFVETLESIISPIILVYIMGCTLDLCLLGYYTVMNWAAFDAAKIFVNVFLYISIFYYIFVYCYIGEILTEQCKNVGEIAYMTDWYKLPHTTARSFVLIILRSNQAIKMTAGKIFTLSIATFGDIVKTSLAYMNFLRMITL